MLSFLDMNRRTRSLLPALDVALLIIMGLTALGAGLSLLTTVADGTVSDLTIGLPLDTVDAALPAGVEVDQARAVVDAEIGLGYRLVWWIVGPGAGVLAIWSASVLRDVVVSARNGDPFVADNVRRLRLAALLAAGYWGVTMLGIPVALVIQDRLGIDDARASGDGVPLLVALVLLAVAEIWQRGVDLRDDQELTV